MSTRPTGSPLSSTSSHIVGEITRDTVNTPSNFVSYPFIRRRRRAVSPEYAVADLVSTRTYSKVVRMRLLIMGSIQMSLHEVSQGFEPFDSLGPGVDIPGTRRF